MISNFPILKESSSTGIPLGHRDPVIESTFSELKMGKSVEFFDLAPVNVEILDYQEFLEIFDEFSRWHFNKLTALYFSKFPIGIITRYYQ